jgi:hypothetical protein
MPFLTNSWYVAAWTAEVGSGLLRFWARASCSSVGMIATSPRSMGDVHIALHRCVTVYWWMASAFGVGTMAWNLVSTGACVHNLNDARRPSAIGVRSYPVVEQNRLIWIWLGTVPSSFTPRGSTSAILPACTAASRRRSRTPQFPDQHGRRLFACSSSGALDRRRID